MKEIDNIVKKVLLESLNEKADKITNKIHNKISGEMGEAECAEGDCGEVKEIVSYENRCYACQSFDTLDYCEDDCGEFCSSCNQGSWQDQEAMAKCQTHMVLLPSTEKAEV